MARAPADKHDLQNVLTYAFSNNHKVLYYEYCIWLYFRVKRPTRTNETLNCILGPVPRIVIYITGHIQYLQYHVTDEAGGIHHELPLSLHQCGVPTPPVLHVSYSSCC